jgi:hypothetical protein
MQAQNNESKQMGPDIFQLGEYSRAGPHSRFTIAPQVASVL